MTAPTIVEFLLARIAEDEAEIMTHVIEGHPTNPLDRQRPNGIAWDTETHHSAYFLVIDEERALAECRAKREIVELHGSLTYGNGDPAGDDVLGALALPYADHPDCPSWVTA